MQYRREIDGLRALAVVPVVLFHAGFQAFGGGFVGVDIFFVISGYLITSIIVAERQSGHFSMAGFYERRARRILPALLLVMACCIPFAWAFMAPQDMRSFSQSLVAVSLFASNVLFFLTSGYFDTAAELKPLLHTWSLAVEEQYYLLFPGVLLLAWRFGPLRIMAGLGAVLVVSLVAAQWALPMQPSGAFYLLPTRIWELLLGALLAFYLADAAYPRPGPRIAEMGAATGLALIAAAVLLLDEKTPFPGLWALLPTLGTALVILCAGPSNRVGKLLGLRAVVGVGLISYSAYLWHQPLFAFARYASNRPPDALWMGLLAASAFVLAYASWRWVERPFRSRQQIRTRVLVLTAGAGTAAMVVFGTLGHFTNGFAARFHIGDPAVAELARIVDPYQHFHYKESLRDGRCHSVSLDALERNGCIDIRERQILLIGDSYAATLYAGLAAVRDARHPEFGIVQVTDYNGPPFDAPGRTDDGKSLPEANRNRIAMAARIRPTLIVVTWMIDGSNAVGEPRAAADELDRTIDRLLDVSPVSQVLVIGPFPRWSGTLQKQMVNAYLRTGQPPPRYMSYGLLEHDAEWDQFFRTRIPRDRVAYASAQDVFCRSEGCLTHIGKRLSDLPVLDWGHLTRDGSVYLARALEDQLFPASAPSATSAR